MVTAKKSALVLLLAYIAASGADIYIAQVSAGADNGTNCANAHSAVWFNTNGNWGGGAGTIVAGDTVHFCGTITSEMAVRGAGSAGSPITFLWESGAKLSQAVGSLMNLTGKDYLILDGGTNGIIENTDNGTDLGNQAAGINGIDASMSEHLIIRNLTIRNLYVHTSVNDNTPFASRHTGIYMNGTGDDITIHGCTFSHMLTGILLGSALEGKSGIRVYNNTFVNVDHGVSLGGAPGVGYSDVRIYNNNFGDTANWDTTDNLWHHDGIHIYHEMNSVITDTRIYNNRFYGDWGNNNTAHIFLEGEYGGVDNPGSGMVNTTIFNNFFTHTNAVMPNGSFIINGLNTIIVNNTILGSGTDDICTQAGTMSDGIIFKNNILSSCKAFVGTIEGTASDSVWDYNIYADGRPYGGGLWSWSATEGGAASGTNTYATWQGWIQADSHSSFIVDAGVNSDGTLQSGSAAILSGVNLTSLGIAELLVDINGRSRPASGAWDIGAYQYAVGAPSWSQRLTGGTMTGGRQ